MLSSRLVTGSGPAEGWISTEIAQKTLARRVSSDHEGLSDTGPKERFSSELNTILDKGTKQFQAFACDQEDLQMFDAIRHELSQGQRPFSGNWRPAQDGQWKTPWRNGLGSEQVEASNGQKLPNLAKTLQKLSEIVNCEMQQWWANVYEDGSVGCEFHHDGHAEWNVTVGASFGASRYLTFYHEETGAERSFLQRNGDIFAFDHSVDEKFMHGVYPVKDEAMGARISVIIMGRLRRGYGIHSNFLQDQNENRQKFGRDCMQQIQRLKESIEFQATALLDKEIFTLEDSDTEALEVCRSDLVAQKQLTSRVVQHFLEELDRAPTSCDGSTFAKLQMKGVVFPMEVFTNWGELHEDDRINVVATPLILANNGNHLFRTMETPCKEFVVRGDIPVDGGSFAMIGLKVRVIHPVTVCCIDEQTGIFPIQPCQMADMYNIVELCAGMGAFSATAGHCGFRVIAGVDHNDKWKSLFEAGHAGAKFIHGDCASPDAMKELFRLKASHAMVLSGIACQPHSRGGDKLGMMDSRSSSLHRSLQMSWILQSPITILECVPDVMDNQEFQKVLHEYGVATGCHIRQRVLKLSNFWPAKRDRWYACITASILGPIDVPDMPTCGAFSKIVDVIPYLQVWPQTDMDQLLLSEMELNKFKQFSRGGIEQRFINMEGTLPTCLHSAGNQLIACRCGCRGPLSDRRLQERGLYGTLIPVDSQDESPSAYRYMHPREMFVMNGGDPLFPFEDLRLGLAAVGQCVSPFQGVWLLSHVATHLAAFLKHDQVDPHYVLHQYLQWLLDRRDECWPPMSVHQLVPCKGLKSCMRVKCEADAQQHGSSSIVAIADDTTLTCIEFRAAHDATVQQFVDAQMALQGGQIVWPKSVSGHEYAHADMELCNLDLVL
eukprot:symbB.v1.2.005950.t2/scaffold351.1/size221948/1